LTGREILVCGCGRLVAQLVWEIRYTSGFWAWAVRGGERLRFRDRRKFGCDLSSVSAGRNVSVGAGVSVWEAEEMGSASWVVVVGEFLPREKGE
jgi:hypothetical protein